MAADEFDAPVLADFGAAAEKDCADLAGAADVRAAPGLQINAGNLDGAKRARAFDLFADTCPGELFGSAIADGDFAVFEDDGIGRAGSAFEDKRRRLRAL
jgi:hypothetical protein